LSITKQYIDGQPDHSDRRATPGNDRDRLTPDRRPRLAPKLSVISPLGHEWNHHGWCYFGNGVDSSGAPRTMATAMAAAFLAAAVWDGDGDPPGHDKKAF